MKNNLPVEGGATESGLQPFAIVSEGLYYTSETDAEIVPFGGEEAAAVTVNEVRRQAGIADGEPAEEIEPAMFFDQLTRERDWFGEVQKERAARFAALYEELKEKLIDLGVFRFGRIQIDILIVGLDAEGRLAGVRTKAVET